MRFVLIELFASPLNKLFLLEFLFLLNACLMLKSSKNHEESCCTLDLDLLAISCLYGVHTGGSSCSPASPAGAAPRDWELCIHPAGALWDVVPSGLDGRLQSKGGGAPAGLPRGRLDSQCGRSINTWVPYSRRSMLGVIFQDPSYLNLWEQPG